MNLAEAIAEVIGGVLGGLADALVDAGSRVQWRRAARLRPIRPVWRRLATRGRNR